MVSLIELAQIVVSQTSGDGPAAGPLGGMVNLVPMVLIIVVMYFLLIRPASKQRKDHQKLLNNLKKDDRVVTNGGIFGRIISVEEKVATLEIADKVKIRILKERIGGLWEADAKVTKN